MNVLLLSPWFPWPPFGGALIRVFETLRHLSQRHRVTLLAPASLAPTAEHVAALKEFCATVVVVPVSESPTAIFGRAGTGLVRGMPLIQGLHYDASLAHRLRQLTEGNAYDVIQFEHTFMAPYLAAVSPGSAAKTVLSMHNIESLRFRREMQVARWGSRRLVLLADSLLFPSWEEHAIRQFDGIAAVSAFEEQWARAHAPAAKVALVPNGVNVDHFKSTDRTPARRSIVFPGLMNYPPNADAVEWFCDAVFPLVARRHPDVMFSIVGDKPPASVRALAQRPGIEVTGRVPDVRPYLEDCRAVVVPVRSGAGTRLKILEAMAMSRPVVATSLGAEGLRVTSGENILIGDTPEAFANHTCSLLSNALLADRMGRAARRVVESTYDWRMCFRNLDALYDALTGRHASDDVAAKEAVQ